MKGRGEQGGGLKQVGVCAGTLKSNRTLYFVNFIDKHPIALDVTFKRIFPFALKRVVPAFGGRGCSLMINAITSVSLFISIPRFFISLRSLLKGPVNLGFSMG